MKTAEEKETNRERKRKCVQYLTHIKMSDDVSIKVGSPSVQSCG